MCFNGSLYDVLKGGDRLAGYKVYVSKSAKRSGWSQSENCYSYPNTTAIPDNENVATINVTCPGPIAGRYVTIYNERLVKHTYPPTWSTYAILVLCEVEVQGEELTQNSCNMCDVIF